MHIICYVIFIVIGLIAVFNSKSRWSDSKTWYYNEQKLIWEEAGYISSSTYTVKNNSKIVVPGMKDKD